MNYRPVSLLSVLGKIMESEINRTLVQHIFKSNNLASDKQLAYRVGYSTELLLIHLTESWRRAVDSGMAVAKALIKFKKSVWPYMQLPQWKTTIYCAKWCKVGFVTYVDGDPTYSWITIVLSYDWKNRVTIVKSLTWDCHRVLNITFTLTPGTHSVTAEPFAVVNRCTFC